MTIAGPVASTWTPISAVSTWPRVSAAVTVTVCVAVGSASASTGTPTARKAPVSGSTVAVTEPTAVVTVTESRWGSPLMSIRPETSMTASPSPREPCHELFSGEVMVTGGPRVSSHTITRSVPVLPAASTARAESTLGPSVRGRSTTKAPLPSGSSVTTAGRPLTVIVDAASETEPDTATVRSNAPHPRQG